MKDKNEDHKYRGEYFSVFHSIFHYAVHELKILEKETTSKMEIPVKAKIQCKKEFKYFSLMELNQLLDFMVSYQHQRFNEYRIY